MLPRALRLRKNREFQAVYSRRRTWTGAHLTLSVRLRGPYSGPPRFGVVVSKKIAKRAHDRNRIKRRVTEICRTRLILRLRQSADLVFAARPFAQDASFTELATEMERLMMQAGLLQAESPETG